MNPNSPHAAEMIKPDKIKIVPYENWMFDQVLNMIVNQYGFNREKYSLLFKRFYETPFQQKNGIRLAAVDGKTVCGFQSYFYWPYYYQGKIVRAFQSGNSLVSEKYRGRQIFARLLNDLYQSGEIEKRNIDLLIGFPVQMSYGSFIRNGWQHPSNLVWYIKPIHPFSVIRGYHPTPEDWKLDNKPESLSAYYPTEQIALSKDADFCSWRQSYQEQTSNLLYVHFRNSSGAIRFELKSNRRSRLNEMVLGDIVRTSPDEKLLQEGLRALVRNLKQHSFLTFLSIALNEKSNDPALLNSIRKCGFFRQGKIIRFIVKPIKELPAFTDAGKWLLLRSDIDTW